MKLTLLLTILTVLKSAAFVFSQQISINKKGISLEEMLKVIRKQTGYNVLYSPQIMRKAHPFDIQVYQKDIAQVLKQAFTDQPLTYTLNEKTIIIKEKAVYARPSAVLGQQDIRGTVSDSQGKPIPGVTVVLKGTNTATQTDEAGAFTLKIGSDNAQTLLFTSVGYLSKEVSVSSGRLSVTLVEDQTNLEQVVIIGYGTQKKGDITGSVSSIKSTDFNKGTNTTFDQLISGKAAGVQVVQNSAEPGGGVSVRIRGASSINAGSSPLYVIDGLPIDNAPVVTGSGANFDAPRAPRNPLAAINPADIESIEILKDASATAIYGARGANGVVIVTTKKGKDGATSVNYNASLGLQQVAHKIDLLNAQEYKSVLNSLIDAGGGAETYRIGDEVAATDWQDEIFNNQAFIQNHSLSLTGGNTKTKFYTSFNYFDQKGVVKSSGFKRYSAKLNLTSTITEKLEAGVSLNVSYTRDDYIPGGFGINNESGAIYAALNFDPTVAIRNNEGTYNLSPFLDMDNPLALLDGSNTLANTYRTFGTAYAKYQLFPGLSAKINVGGDFNSQRRDVYVSRITRVGGPLGGSASVLQGLLSNYLAEATLNFDKQWNRHSVSAVIGATTQRFIADNTNQNARNFPSDLTDTYNLGLGDQSTYRMGSERRTNRLQSYLGRINYDFNDKYLLTASFRIDGSSHFGENNKFGYFPSFAFGWKMHQEAFLQSADFLSNLKPRLSWGQTGNQEIGDYAAITTFSTGPLAILDDQLVTSTNPARIANPDLRWETTEQFNVGLDFGFFKERISGSIDYYQKKTFNMLLNLPIPTTTGFTSILSNVGSIRNKGWDFSLNTVNLRGNFGWTSSINLSTISNEVLDLGGVGQIITGNAGQTSQVFLIQEGSPVYAFYGYEIEGIWQTTDDFSVTRDPVSPGDIKYKDQNSDGVVNAEDRTILGNSFPKLVWSFGNNFTYKNWQLSVFMEGVQGVDMLNNNLVDAYFPVQFRRNRFAEPYLNRWTPENPSNRYPSFVNPTGQGSKLVNTYTVEDASYMRLRTLSLSYNLPLNKKYIKNLGLSLTTENLFTITDYSGFDPSVNPNGGAFNRIDFNAYPVAKTFLLGVSVDF